MRKNLDCRLTAAATAEQAGSPLLSTTDQAQRLRGGLGAFLGRLAAGAQPVRLPRPAHDWVARGDGHFHLAPELFLQMAGWTQFRFPHAELLLGPGEALLLPPRLLHAERIGAADGEDFCNIVIYAENSALTCHLAHEAEPGKPGILHLEARRHAQAQHLQHWLTDAARLGHAPGGDEAAWSATQARALVMTAIAGVLRALDDGAAEARPEPPLVAHVRVLIQNQLGDCQLSVRRLAEQAGCTADYLSHVFRHTAGEHLAAYINRQRMERAAHLLVDTSLAGKEVAWACGFATQSYFIRTFRAHFGMTPKVWRAGRDPSQDSVDSAAARCNCALR